MAIDPTHKRIARGTLIVGFLVIATRVAFALREMAVAWRYGTGPAADAFQLALTISTWIALTATGALTVVLVPRLVGLRGDTERRRPFIAELNGRILLAALAIGAAVWIGAPFAVELMAGPLQPSTGEIALDMSRWMAPVGALTLVCGYLAARLQARERHGYTAAEGLPAVAVVLFVLAAPASPDGDPLVYGMLAGLALQAGLLVAMIHRSEGGIGRVSFGHRSREWQSLHGALLMLAAGQLLISVAMPIDQIFAASLGAGAVASYGYANRIVGLLLTFGPVVIGRAVLPVTSEMVATRELALGRKQILKWTWLMFAAGIAALLAGWLLAPWIVHILYERGAFDADDSALVAEVVRFGLFQMPPFLGGLVLVQWFAALRRYDVLLGAAMIALAVKLGLNLLLVPAWGMAGLMLANAGMYLATFIAQLYFIRSADARTA